MPSFQSADAQINYQTLASHLSLLWYFPILWAPTMACGKNSLMS